jgi:hypothetical protein
MKKILSAFALFTLTQNVFSQNSQPIVLELKQKTSTTFYNNNNKDSQTRQTFYLNNINIKALRDFKQSYKTVSDEEWYETPDGFEARFTLDNADFKVDYNKRGNWLATSRTYDEKEMAKDIRARVKMIYFDYTIKWIEEIEVPHHTTYFVHLEGTTELINLIVSDEDMDVYQKFDKSK